MLWDQWAEGWDKSFSLCRSNSPILQVRNANGGGITFGGGRSRAAGTGGKDPAFPLASCQRITECTVEVPFMTGGAFVWQSGPAEEALWQQLEPLGLSFNTRFNKYRYSKWYAVKITKWWLYCKGGGITFIQLSIAKDLTISAVRDADIQKPGHQI